MDTRLRCFNVESQRGCKCYPSTGYPRMDFKDAFMYCINNIRCGQRSKKR